MHNYTEPKKRLKNTKKLIQLLKFLDVIKDQKYATDEEIEAIDQRVKDLVEECATFAEESPFPEVQQLYDVVYEQENYPFIPHKL
jgi:pyruvate dehydrogenase E1 component alpha subunit